MSLEGGRPRQLTPWRKHLALVPSSFSPDGDLAASRQLGNGRFDAVSIPLDGSPIKLLERDAREPVYSPDGSQMAFVRARLGPVPPGPGTALVADLFVRPATGGEATPLTATGGVAEVSPTWDPSGRRISYLSLDLVALESFGVGFSVGEINLDGTCPTTIAKSRGVFSAPVWQPGRGREAGPIAC